VDPLAAIEAAAAALGEHEDLAVRRVGAWLASFPSELLAEFSVENGATVARRDELLRRTRLSASRLAREIRHYRGTAWAARDRHAAANPYAAEDLRSTMWRVLKIRDRDIGRRQIDRILRHGHSGPSNVQPTRGRPASCKIQDLRAGRAHGAGASYRDAGELADATAALNTVAGFSARGGDQPNTAASDALVAAADGTGATASPATADVSALVDAAGGAGRGRQRFAGDPITRLPAPAAAKLRRLRAADQDTAVLARNLSELRNEEIQRRNEHGLRLAQLTDRNVAERYGTEIVTDPEHPSVIQATRRRNEAEREIAELDTRLSTLRAQRSARLLANVENWLRALPPGHILEMHEPVDPPKVKGDIAAAVDALRSKIANHKADLHEVRSACLPSHIVRDRVRTEITALAERGAIDVLPVIEAGLPLRWPQLEVRGEIHGHVPTAEGGAQPLVGFSTQPSLDVKAIMAFLFQDAIIEKLDDEISQLSDDETALTPEDRAAREDALNAQILAAERVEEQLIELAAAEGRAIPRRADASPAAVLGLAAPR
jgi:hypothetical protein